MKLSNFTIVGLVNIGFCVIAQGRLFGSEYQRGRGARGACEAHLRGSVMPSLRTKQSIPGTMGQIASSRNSIALLRSSQMRTERFAWL